MLHMDYIALTLNVHSSYLNQNLLVQHLQATATSAIFMIFIQLETVQEEVLDVMATFLAMNDNTKMDGKIFWFAKSYTMGLFTHIHTHK